MLWLIEPPQGERPRQQDALSGLQDSHPHDRTIGVDLVAMCVSDFAIGKRKAA